MIMAAEKPVHHQLKRSVGLFDIRVRGAGGGWPHRSRTSRSEICDMNDVSIVRRCAQPKRASVRE